MLEKLIKFQDIYVRHRPTDEFDSMLLSRNIDRSTHYKTYQCPLLRVGTLIITLILSACSTTSTEQTADRSSKKVSKTSVTGTNKETVADKNFDQDTLYSLLVAEMALDRQRLDIAKSNYVQQANKTGDLAVIERAAKIANVTEDTSHAVELSERWSKADPYNVEAKLIYLNALINNKQYLRAFDESTILASWGEDTAFYDIAVKASEEDSFQLDSLSIKYGETVERFPEDEQLLTAYSILLQREGKFNAAMTMVDKAIQNNPEEIRHSYQKLRVLQAMGKEEDAFEMFETMVKRYPENRRLRLRYASLLVTKDLSAAEKQYEQLHAQDPSDHDALLALALVQQRNQNTSAAQLSFKKLILMDQHLDAAHFGLAEIAESKNNQEEALENYGLVTNGPRHYNAIKASALIIEQQQGLNAAQLYLTDKSIGLDEDAKLQITLAKAELFYRKKNYTEAERIYTQALQRSPNNLTLLYARSLLYADNKQIEKSEADLLKVIQQNPENASALNALGYSLANQTTRYQEALAYIERAYAIQPNDAAILDSLGWVEYKLGNLTRAREYLEQAMGLVPDDEIAAHLGEVLWKLGETVKAQKVWRQGLELDSESKHILETMKRLDAAVSSRLNINNTYQPKKSKFL